MERHKYYSIVLIIILFVLFSCKIFFKAHSYNVLKVISPFEIVVDKNNDGIIDEEEFFKIDEAYEYITKDSKSYKLGLALELDDYTRLSLAYLTEKFFNDVLLDKKVDIKHENGKDVIYLAGDRYSNILEKSGYLFKNYKPVNKDAYQKRLLQIKKADYKIYNIKSNIYHNLTCEYGQKARNYVLLSKSQLPKGAKPCGYCCHTTKKFKKQPKKENICPSLVYSSGYIKIFLTDYTRNLVPNRFANTNISKALIKQIDNSKSTIDIAIYGYDRVPKIEKALQRAINRGVRVRLVHDVDSGGKNIYANTFEFSNLIKNSVSDKPNRAVSHPMSYSNSIMHDKFYIFDNSVVITGSANLSHTDMSDYNGNCVVMLHSKEVANIYTQEFEQMYNHKFHNLKDKISNKTNLKLGNVITSIYFSPKDNIIQSAFIPLINSAKHYIYIPVFVLTDNELAQALIKAKQRGVDVRVIVDATNAKNPSSKHKILRQYGVPVKTENYAGKLHSKSIIIDDKYTIIGSMNFSKSGQYKNDENVVILESKQIAVFYKNFFNYLWHRINKYWLTHDVSAESIYSIGSCSDGIDNDYDGKTDTEDEGCRPKK